VQTSWALGTLHEALTYRHDSLGRLGLECAAGILAPLALDWSSSAVQDLSRHLVSRLEGIPEFGVAAGKASAEAAEAEAAAVAHALAALMQRLEAPRLGRPSHLLNLLPELVSGLVHLLSGHSAQQAAGGSSLTRRRLELASLQSLTAVARASTRRLPPALLQAARAAIDPFVLSQLPAPRNSDETAHTGQTLVTERDLRAASLACLGALAAGAAWDKSSMQQHAVWMMERILLALDDDDHDDASVREAALAALVDAAQALGDTFYPFLDLVRPPLADSLVLPLFLPSASLLLPFCFPSASLLPPLCFPSASLALPAALHLHISRTKLALS